MAGKPIWEVFETNTSQTRTRCATRNAAVLAKKMLEAERSHTKYEIRQRRLLNERTLRRILENGLRTVVISYQKKVETTTVTERSKIETFLGFAGTVGQIGVYESSQGFRVVISDVVADTNERAIEKAVVLWEGHKHHDDYLSALFEWRASQLTDYTPFHITKTLNNKTAGKV